MRVGAVSRVDLEVALWGREARRRGDAGYGVEEAKTDDGRCAVVADGQSSLRRQVPPSLSIIRLFLPLPFIILLTTVSPHSSSRAFDCLYQPLQLSTSAT